MGAQWLSGRVLDWRPKGRGFEPHRRQCVVSLSKNIYPSLVLVQPRKTHPFITERLLMGRKESNQTKQIDSNFLCYFFQDNRTWIPSLSPIVIRKPISILASGSLTIQAGVSVIFTSEDAGLSVFGKSLVMRVWIWGEGGGLEFTIH